MSKKEKKEKNIKNKYNFGYYFTLYKAVVKIFEKKYKPDIDKQAYQDMDRPCLVFCNHGSVFDFILAGAVILPKKAVFVTTRRTMFEKSVNFVVNKSPHILRDQFSADVKSIMDMRDAIKQGYDVVLYPEGKVSTCGKTNNIPKATGKLVKTFKIPVITIKSSGNWLVKPSWASHLRIGKVKLQSKLILDEEQIKKLSADEIQLVLEKELSYNDNQYQLENNYNFYNIKKKFGFAEGLEKVLYKCPKCASEYEMSTKGDEIYCEHCGFKAKYNHNGLIESEDKDFNYDRIDKWYDYEKESLKNELCSEDFCLKSEVDAYYGSEEESKYEKFATGTLALNKEEITFTSEKINLVHKIDKVESIPFVVGTKIYLLIDGKTCEFAFKDKLMSTKYNMAVELLAEERNAKKEERRSSSKN